MDKVGSVMPSQMGFFFQDTGVIVGLAEFPDGDSIKIVVELRFILINIPIGYADRDSINIASSSFCKINNHLLSS